MSGHYLMATKAMHKLGDISRDEPDLCVVFSETDTDYIGRWVEGFGFANVRFPKATTRELTAEEKARYDGRYLAMGDVLLGPTHIDGEECN